MQSIMLASLPTGIGYACAKASAGREAYTVMGDSDVIVFGRYVLVGVVCQQGSRDETDDRANRHVYRDRQAGMERGVQRCRDERRRAAGDDRGKLVAQRCVAVSQTR